MRTNFTLGNYIFDIGLTSRHNWDHFKIHQTEYSRHLVWGKLSIQVIDNSIECHPVCGECGSSSLHNSSVGDETFSICESCRTIEGKVDYVNYSTAEQAECV